MQEFPFAIVRQTGMELTLQVSRFRSRPEKRRCWRTIAELTRVPPDFLAEPLGGTDERPGLGSQEPPRHVQHAAASRELDGGLQAFARRGARHHRLLRAQQSAYAGEAGHLRKGRLA